MLIFRIKEDLNDLHSVDFIYIRCTQEIFLETFILSFEFLLPMLFVVAKRCYTVRLLEAWLIISCPPFFFFFFFYYHQPLGQRIRLFSTHLWAFLPFPLFSSFLSFSNTVVEEIRPVSCFNHTNIRFRTREVTPSWPMPAL